MFGASERRQSRRRRRFGRACATLFERILTIGRNFFRRASLWALRLASFGVFWGAEAATFNGLLGDVGRLVCEGTFALFGGLAVLRCRQSRRRRRFGCAWATLFERISTICRNFFRRVVGIDGFRVALVALFGSLAVWRCWQSRHLPRWSVGRRDAKGESATFVTFRTGKKYPKRLKAAFRAFVAFENVDKNG